MRSLCILPVLVVALVLPSCGPYVGSGHLEVDPDKPRYAEILPRGGATSVAIVRGEGIAELFVWAKVGSSTGWLQVDTGAPLCAITTRVANQEGFRAFDAGSITTASGSAGALLGTIPSLRLGTIEVRDATVLSLDDDYPDAFTVNGKRGGVLGVLGADLLDHLDATLDLRANRLTLRP